MERILSKFGTKQLWFHVTQFFSRCGRTEREQEKSLDSSTFFRFDSDPGKEIRRHQDKCHAEHFRDGAKAKMSGTELP